MPNFANKSRLPTMDGAMVTELVRTSVAATSSGTASQTPKSTFARSSSLQHSFASRGSIVFGGRLLSQVLPSARQSITQQPQGETMWALVDTTGAVWTANAEFSVVRSVGVTVPKYTIADETQRFQWIGTGWMVVTDAGRAVYRVSQDLTTWTYLPTLSTTTGEYYTKVVFTTNPLILYFISTAVGLYKSTDGGTTWTLRTGGSPILNTNHTDLVVLSTGRLVLSHSSNPTTAKIYTSDDDGVSWVLREEFVSGGATFLDISRIGSRLFVGARQTMYTSTDNGTTWSALPSLVSTPSTYVTTLKQHVPTYVAVVTNPGGAGGPAWTPDPLTTQLTLGTTTDGAQLRGWDYYSLQLRYNGTRFSFTNINNNRLYTSADGKVWSPVAHPISGRQFWIAAPKVTDPTKVQG